MSKFSFDSMCVKSVGSVSKVRVTGGAVDFSHDKTMTGGSIVNDRKDLELELAAFLGVWVGKCKLHGLDVFGVNVNFVNSASENGDSQEVFSGVEVIYD